MFQCYFSVSVLWEVQRCYNSLSSLLVQLIKYLVPFRAFKIFLFPEQDAHSSTKSACWMPLNAGPCLPRKRCWNKMWRRNTWRTEALTKALLLPERTTCFSWCSQAMTLSEFLKQEKLGCPLAEWQYCTGTSQDERWRLCHRSHSWRYHREIKLQAPQWKICQTIFNKLRKNRIFDNLPWGMSQSAGISMTEIITFPLKFTERETAFLFYPSVAEFKYLMPWPDHVKHAQTFT